MPPKFWCNVFIILQFQYFQCSLIVSFLIQDHIDGFLNSKSIGFFGFYLLISIFISLRLENMSTRYKYRLMIVLYVWWHVCDLTYSQFFITVPWTFKSDMFSLNFCFCSSLFYVAHFSISSEAFFHLRIFIKCLFSKNIIMTIKFSIYFVFSGWATWSYYYLNVIYEMACNSGGSNWFYLINNVKWLWRNIFIPGATRCSQKCNSYWRSVRNQILKHAQWNVSSRLRVSSHDKRITNASKTIPKGLK